MPRSKIASESSSVPPLSTLTPQVPNTPFTLQTRRTLELINSTRILTNEIDEILAIDDDTVSNLDLSALREKLSESARLEKQLNSHKKELSKLISFWESASLSRTIPSTPGFSDCYRIVLEADPTSSQTHIRTGLDIIANIRTVLRSEVEKKASDLTPSMSKLLASPPSSKAPTDRTPVRSTSPGSDSDDQGWHAPSQEILSFNGDPEKWPNFWADFKRFIHDAKLPTSSKYASLRKLLSGEAAQRICLLPPDKKYYTKAIEMLQHFYGSEEKTAVKLVENLLRFRPTIRSQKDWHDAYAFYYQNLTALRAMGHSDDIIFARFLLTSLAPCSPLYNRIVADASTELPSTDQILNSWYAMEPPVSLRTPQRTITSNIRPDATKLPTAEGPRRACNLCKENHSTYTCTTFPAPSSRREQATSLGLCLNCLSNRHKLPDCKSARTCQHCSKRHHSSICMTPVEGAKASDITFSAVVSQQPRHSLMCARAAVCHPEDPSEHVECTIFFDSGSSRTYVSPSLSKILNLTPTAPWEGAISTFGSSSPLLISTDISPISVQTLDGEHVTMDAIVFQPCNSPIQHIALTPYDLHNLPALPAPENVTPDILVGADYFFWFFMNARTQTIRPGVFLSHTLLGPILSGKLGSATPLINCFSAQEIPDLTRFWEVEQLGISDCHDALDAEAAAFVKSTIKWEATEGRYAVKWPWIGGRPPANSGKDGLPSNLSLCVKRLSALLTSLRRRPESLVAYDTLLKEQLSQGILERAFPRTTPDQLVHYLPHHAVLKESNVGVKVRQVYDASSHVKDALSLNDHLLRGPVLLPNIASILLRFRTYATFLIADIEKAFHQVLLQEEDRDVCRLLWVKDTSRPPCPENLMHLRFRVVPFGVKPSPFLLAITILVHLEQHPSPLASPILRDLYVDNILIPAPVSLPATLSLQSDMQVLFADIKMNVREFVSNVPKFHDSPPNTPLPSSIKILGLCWASDLDSFLFSLPTPSTSITTKRHLASISAQLMDPLGLVAPLMVPFKLLLQKAWKISSPWDTPLPESIVKEVPPILLSLSSPIRISRFCGDIASHSQELPVILHACSDASGVAYGACIYIQGPSGTSLVFSKGKVAPLSKSLTIPQLELLGVVTAIKAVAFVRSSLSLPEATPVHIWCDNKPVLHWISGSPVDSIFVRNRIRLIRAASKYVTFHFIPTAHNPADMLSRGVFSHEFDQSTWYTAPYLQSHLSSDIFTYSPPSDVMLSAIAAPIPEPPSFCLPPHSYDSFLLLITLISRLLRFLHKWSKGRCPSILSTPATRYVPLPRVILRRYAHTVAFRWAQLEQPPSEKERRDLQIFEDPQGVLRCRTRLDNSPLPYETSHPVFLSPKARITELYILHIHQTWNHCSLITLIRTLRDAVWIPRIRIVSKKVVHHCSVCHREAARRYAYPPFPQLPSIRTNPSPPFTHVGVDYLGPFQLEEKVWVCLFTCLSTRAIQCELVNNLSGARFLHILRRFIARRGVPHTILSDNGLCFQYARRLLADSYVSQFLTFHSIEWKLITEFAPWQGGVYERMVGLFKKSLYTTVNRKLDHHLDVESFVTFIHEAEAVVNSRPLGQYMMDKEHVPIRPCDLLTPGKPLLTSPTLFPDSICMTKEDSCVVNRYNFVQSLSNHFWEVWSADYLQSLHERPQRSLKIHGRQMPSSVAPAVNDHVILEDKKLPRNLWRTGQIIGLKNGVRSRAAVVQVENGRTVQRPISSLFKMEMALTLLCLLQYFSPCSGTPPACTFKDAVFATTCQSNGFVVRTNGSHYCREDITCRQAEHIREVSGSFSCSVLQCTCPSWAYVCSPPTSTHRPLADHLHALLSDANVPLCHPLITSCRKPGSLQPLYRLLTSDNSTFHLHSVTLRFLDTPPAASANVTCLGSMDAPTSGSPAYCRHHHCDDIPFARRFCYYKEPASIYLELGTQMVPISAVGQVMEHVRSTPFDLSPLPSCSSCSASCRDTSVAFESPYGPNTTIKACFLTRAHSWSCISSNSSADHIPYPSDSQTPATCSVFIYHQGQLTWSDHLVCPLDSCYRPDCLFCEPFRYYLLHCFTFLWSSISVLLFLVICAASLPFLCCIVTLWRCSKRCLSYGWGLLRLLIPRRRDSILVPPPNSHHSRIRSFRRLRNKLRLSLLLLLPLHTMTCDTVHSISSTGSVVQEHGDDGSMTVSRFSSLISTRAHNTTACFFLGDESSNLGSLSITLQKPVLRCVKSHWYFTMDHLFRTPSITRCFNSGSCKENVCNTLDINDTVTELEGLHPNKGHTFCLPSCGCLTCGCFHCSPACLFFKIYPVPTDHRLYEMFSCPQWSVHIPFHGVLTNQTSSSSFQGALEAGHSFRWNNLTLTLSSQSFPPLNIPDVFLRDTDNSQITLLPSAAPRGSPIPSLPGQLQCASRHIESCNYSPSTCQCSNDYDNGAVCRCPEAKLAPLFSDSENLLPRSHGHLLLQTDPKDKSVFAELENAASVQLLFESSVSRFTARESLTSCIAEASPLSGCYGCMEGATTSVACSSITSITARLECPTGTYEILCGAEAVNNTLTVHVTESDPQLDCVLVCPSSQSPIHLSGSLYAKGLPFLTSLIFSRVSAPGQPLSLEFRLPSAALILDSLTGLLTGRLYMLAALLIGSTLLGRLCFSRIAAGIGYGPVILKSHNL